MLETHAALPSPRHTHLPPHAPPSSFRPLQQLAHESLDNWLLRKFRRTQSWEDVSARSGKTGHVHMPSATFYALYVTSRAAMAASVSRNT
jgi:hypothetical protein